ncbi:unnamed protein product [Leptidea sinapis]|uniref:Uncharacterized protein n=1 Tax=Leptidea sinapis TaxID=189913 RepID=A0A5E4R4N9_9NEOP|nr:unnamed protein product [Leptidea sinapis]
MNGTNFIFTVLMIENKSKVVEKKGGEKPPEIQEGNEVFMKTTRNRKGKEMPRYEKAKVIGKIDRNIVPRSFDRYLFVSVTASYDVQRTGESSWCEYGRCGTSASGDECALARLQQDIQTRLQI